MERPNSKSIFFKHTAKWFKCLILLWEHLSDGNVSEGKICVDMFSRDLMSFNSPTSHCPVWTRCWKPSQENWGRGAVTKSHRDMFILIVSWDLILWEKWGSCSESTAVPTRNLRPTCTFIVNVQFISSSYYHRFTEVVKTAVPLKRKHLHWNLNIQLLWKTKTS